MAKRTKGTRLNDFIVDTWGGLNTSIKSPKDILPGTSPDSLNWITGWDPVKKKGDHIELRRGMALLGTNRNVGNGKISGLGVGSNFSGTQVPFWAYGTNIVYYDVASDTSKASDLTLPTAASSDWVSIEAFQGLPGAFVYISSPNSSLYKIAVANPASYLDITGGTFQGFINFSGGRMNMWQKQGNTIGTSNVTDLLQSGLDFGDYSNAGLTNGESMGTGNGTTLTFTHTLAASGSVFQPVVIGASARGAAISAISQATSAVISTSTAHGLSVGSYLFVDSVGGMTQINQQVLLVVSVQSTTQFTVNFDSSSSGAYTSGGYVYPASEYWRDDMKGNMTSNLGGTGTINYISKVVSITFKGAAPVSGEPVLISYYYQAPKTGVENFTIPGSPAVSDPYSWSQRDAGDALQAVQTLGGGNYCFHLYRTWVETTDSNARSNSTNIPYRNNIGTPFFKSTYPTGDGVIFIDTTVPSDPKFEVLAIAPNTTVATVEPFRLSDNLDLSGYAFDYPPVIFWDVFYLFSCQNIVNGTKQGFNGTTFMMNTLSGYWDKLDYQVSLFEKYYGTLLGGSSVSNNVFTLFSGFDDDGAPINNYWTSGVYNFGFNGLKTAERFVIEGLMQPAQALEVWVSYDQGPYTLVQTINGTDQCVAQGNPQIVGSNTVGSTTVGSGMVYANPFLLDFSLASDLFNYVQVKLVAKKIGYIEIDKFAIKNIQMKSQMLQPTNTL